MVARLWGKGVRGCGIKSCLCMMFYANRDSTIMSVSSQSIFSMSGQCFGYLSMGMSCALDVYNDNSTLNTVKNSCKPLKVNR